VPDGLRRFATWAPLLIPFYIPRGTEWDQVWVEAERMQASAPSLLPLVADVLMGYAVCIGAAVLMVPRLTAHAPCRPRRRGRAVALAAQPAARQRPRRRARRSHRRDHARGDGGGLAARLTNMEDRPFEPFTGSPCRRLV
jgi:hypothetical protein